MVVSSAYSIFESRLRTWAGAQADIRAVLVVGSRSREDPPTDPYADLDIILITPLAGERGTDRGWLADLGEVLLAVPTRTGRGDPEWQALYRGGLKVDFVLAGVAVDAYSAPLEDLLAASPYGFVYRRGLRLLFDRFGEARPVALPPPVKEDLPSPEQFTAQVERFLLAAARAWLFLRRGDYMRAAGVCNCELRAGALAMLALQLRATGTQDTWEDGRSLETWAPFAVEPLVRATALPAYESVHQSITTLLDLFLTAARSAAVQLGIPFPESLAGGFSDWVQSI